MSNTLWTVSIDAEIPGGVVYQEAYPVVGYAFSRPVVAPHDYDGETCFIADVVADNEAVVGYVDDFNDIDLEHIVSVVDGLYRKAGVL